MDFVNLTPHTAEVLDGEGEVISAVKPSGKVGIAAGDPPKLLNVPPPQDGVVYIVLPALTEASDRDDLVSIEPENAQRSHRGNVRTHICHWSNA
jgi:hypothetical protein